MEEVRSVVGALLRAESERYLALVYLVWIPPFAVGTYVSLATGLWTALTVASVVGAVLYAWTIRSYSKLFAPRPAKRASKLLVALVVALIAVPWALGVLGLPVAWGVALGVGAVVVLFAAAFKYPSRKTDAASGAALVALTVLGSSALNPWEAFALSVIAVYSSAALAHLVYGLYEVVPYAEGGER